MLTYTKVNAQDICNFFVPSLDTATIFIPATADLRFNNQALAVGSTLVAIDPQGNCCSQPVTWMQQDLTININGENFPTEGFMTGDLIRFFVGNEDSCFVEVDSVYFDVNGLDQTVNYVQDSSYVLDRFNAVSNFGIDSFFLDNPMCEDSIGSVGVFVSGGQFPITYSWSHDSTLNSGFINDLNLGNYELVVSERNGCVDTLNFDIELDPPPVSFEFLIDSFQYTCDTLVVSNALDCPNCTYLWSNGVFTEDNVLDEEGEYVVLINNGGCDKLDTLIVDFIDKPEIEIITASSQVCFGDTIQLSAVGGENYVWNSSAQLLSSSGEEIEAVILTETLISVIGDNNCKSDTSEFLLDVYPFPTAGEDKCYADQNQAVQLEASGAIEYFWENNPVGPVSDQNIADPFVSPSETTDYIVGFVDQFGCKSSDTVRVEFISDIIEFTELYNVISPNGDGKNDVLYFDSAEKANSATLVVYDRRKKVVYESGNYQNDWGGTFKNKALPAGTYYYILTINGTQLRSNLTIVYE